MSNKDATNDPMEFTRNLWGQMGFSLPSMVTPTLDVDELEKRLADLRTVEAWLKMNLSMLQLTIQGLEMQCTTLNAVRNLGSIATPGTASSTDSAKPAAGTEENSDPLQAAMWPWALMQQIQSQMQQAAENLSNVKSDHKRPDSPETR